MVRIINSNQGYCAFSKALDSIESSDQGSLVFTTKADRCLRRLLQEKSSFHKIFIFSGKSEKIVIKIDLCTIVVIELIS